MLSAMIFVNSIQAKKILIKCFAKKFFSLLHKLMIKHHIISGNISSISSQKWENQENINHFSNILHGKLFKDVLTKMSILLSTDTSQECFLMMIDNKFHSWMSFKLFMKLYKILKRKLLTLSLDSFLPVLKLSAKSIFKKCLIISNKENNPKIKILLHLSQDLIWSMKKILLIRLENLQNKFLKQELI